MMNLITLARLSIARTRERMAQIEYDWAKLNAPELAERKLRALYQARRARIKAAARRAPKISRDGAVFAAVCALAAVDAAIHWFGVVA
ncbi:MAG: hypothetical protein RBR77_04380 [Thauera sp.]|jgi:hypothetical protein|nr:hypothetical protein [Thauera sp.]